MNVLTIDYNAANAPELFARSLRETGFAVLSYHPISTDLINKAYSLWRDFFNSDHKMQYLYQKPSQAGYFPFRTENAKGNPVRDLKEFYHYYLHGKNPPELTEITTAVFHQLSDMAYTLLEWAEKDLPRHVAAKLSMPLSHMSTNSPGTTLRILHYPPIDGEVEQGAVRAAAHEDINLLTLLPAATAPGLEVLDVKGNWHSVTCDPGNIVVNVADTLQMATDNYYKSTTHRVVNPEGDAVREPRFSMPMFLHARPEVKVSPEYTAEEYLHERLREIGIY